jgi:protein-S-isoprenylcysteine O-methyltransferase Ste14
MTPDGSNKKLSAFVFKNRGALLAIPAVALVVFGRPSALSIAFGVPLAIAGELIRCWAVGYSGLTTRHDAVIAPRLVTGGPYARVRNPLYLGNFVTAGGFAIAFTGANSPFARLALVFGSLAFMVAVYSIIVPHEERFLRAQFGDAFVRYCERVPRIVPRRRALPNATESWHADVLAKAERTTFAIFAAMLAVLALRAFHTTF